MENDVLLMEEKNGILILTLNRPEIMNSLNFKMLHALKAQIEAVRFNTDIRVVIISGAGEKAFCAGADLKERVTLSPIQVKEFITTIRNLFTAIEELNKPVIAAINGVALGGGPNWLLPAIFVSPLRAQPWGLPKRGWPLYPVPAEHRDSRGWLEKERPKNSFSWAGVSMQQRL